MGVELRGPVGEQILTALSPVVVEGLVVRFLHELVHADEVEEAVLSARRGQVGREEGVVHGGQSLLAVEDNVCRVALAVETVERLARQSLKALGLALPE